MDCGGGRGRIEQYVGMLLCLALHGPEWGGGGGAEILFTPHRTFYRHTAATCPPSTFYFMVITPSCRIRKQQQKHQFNELTRHPHFITRHELHICTIVVKSALNSTDRSLEQKQRKTECRWYKKHYLYCNVLKNYSWKISTANSKNSTDASASSARFSNSAFWLMLNIFFYEYDLR